MATGNAVKDLKNFHYLRRCLSPFNLTESWKALQSISDGHVNPSNFWNHNFSIFWLIWSKPAVANLSDN